MVPDISKDRIMVPSLSRIKQCKKNSHHGRSVAMYRCSGNCCWIAEQVGLTNWRRYGRVI